MDIIYLLIFTISDKIYVKKWHIVYDNIMLNFHFVRYSLDQNTVGSPMFLVQVSQVSAGIQKLSLPDAMDIVYNYCNNSASIF